jgi:hypothetical protein
MSLKELRNRIVGQRVTRIDGRDGFRGPTVERIVLGDGTELAFDWTRGAIGNGVGLNVRRTDATEVPRSGRRSYARK